MRVSLQSERTLGDAVSTFLGVESTSVSYEEAMQTWESLLRMTSAPETHETSFSGSLPRTEFISLCLLREWWRKYRTVANSFIYYRIKPKVEDRQDSGQVPAHFMDLEVHGAWYHSALSFLFVREFFRASPFSRLIGTARDRAARMASVHNVALSFCVRTLSPCPSACNPVPEMQYSDPLLPKKDRIAVTATIEACPWLSSDDTSGKPYYLWDIAKKCTIRTPQNHEIPYFCISHTWGRWLLVDDDTRQPLNMAVKGVPWPVPRNSKFEVGELPSLLQNAHLPEEFVWFDLLCIPQCGYQKQIMDEEIAKQAAIFGGSTYTAAWLNDIETWDGTLHALLWLSRKYFVNTSWGSGFQFGERVPDVLIPPLQNSPVDGMDLGEMDQNASRRAQVLQLGGEEPRIPPWFTSLWTLQEYCLRPDMIVLDKEWRPLTRPSGRFIYLDDLVAFMHFCQTTMLRPTRFYDFESDSADRKRWKNRLERYREQDKTYADLARVPYENDISGLWPDGPMELGLLTAGANLIHAHQGPSKILRFGDMRECSGRRAEAIMSALGATKWYAQDRTDFGSALGPGQLEKDLVFGKYPQKFLNEVVEKIGSDFFASRFVHVDLDPQEIQKTLIPTMSPIGSLLPFSGSPYGSGYQVTQHIELETKAPDHPAVKSWTVQADGSVRIRRAGIVAVTHRPRPMLFSLLGSYKPTGRKRSWAKMAIDAPLLHKRGSPVVWIDDEKDLSAAIPSSSQMYLVCLGDGIIESYGILLQHVSPNEGEGSKMMVKIGTWYSSNTIRPKGTKKIASYSLRSENYVCPTTEVDWRVM